MHYVAKKGEIMAEIYKTNEKNTLIALISNTRYYYYGYKIAFIYYIDIQNGRLFSCNKINIYCHQNIHTTSLGSLSKKIYPLCAGYINSSHSCSIVFDKIQYPFSRKNKSQSRHQIRGISII
jgi:hypothetical protein